MSLLEIGQKVYTFLSNYVQFAYFFVFLPLRRNLDFHFNAPPLVHRTFGHCGLAGLYYYIIYYY